jgi:biotin operon repressor
MNAAPLSSPRLQRVLRVLAEAEGKPLSTRQIVRRSGAMAVSTCVAELRQHGAEIECSQRIVNGARRFFYLMKKAPQQ